MIQVQMLTSEMSHAYQMLTSAGMLTLSSMVVTLLVVEYCPSEHTLQASFKGKPLPLTGQQFFQVMKEASQGLRERVRFI